MRLSFQGQVDSLRQQRLEGEALRRQLSTNIHDLKGNIRVFCRVHPGEAPEGIVEVTKSENGQGAVQVQATSGPQPMYVDL